VKQTQTDLEEDEFMQMKWFLTAACFLATRTVSAEVPAVLDNLNDRMSYSLGVEMARILKKQGLESNPDLVVQGFRDARSGKVLLLSEQEIGKALHQLQNDMRRSQSPAVRIIGDDSKLVVASADKRDGLVTLPSGLRYRIIKSADGRKPVDTDTVVYHYRGTLPNGNQFDGSEKGSPITMELLQHTSGWREALKMMPVGSTWQFFVPPKLAFEEWRVTRNKKQSDVLMFEVELIAIK
jgi:FKBP-type peptidyl-prolyl cis-trans isomerase FklB